MKIAEKINLDYEGLIKHGPITIVAFGDSVTHGAVDEGIIDYDTVYWNRLRQKINAVRNYVPVNVINAGIGGITAAGSIERMDAQVFAHNPDLIIICFGLNDVNFELQEYSDALEEIFSKCNEKGVDTIFLTPNMLNTYVALEPHERHYDYAHKTAEMQNSGKMDLFMNSAKEIAKKHNITVCDCYAKWKELSKTEDTTMLLANKINHPTREMHELFAQELFDKIFDTKIVKTEAESTMFKEIKV